MTNAHPRLLSPPARTHVNYELKDDVAVIRINDPTARVCICILCVFVKALKKIDLFVYAYTDTYTHTHTCVYMYMGVRIYVSVPACTNGSIFIKYKTDIFVLFYIFVVYFSFPILCLPNISDIKVSQEAHFSTDIWYRMTFVIFIDY